MRGIESKEVAEKVEKIVRSRTGDNEFTQILSALEKINHRLDKLEAISDLKFEVSHSQLPHPSQERFEVAEAIADGIFDGIQKERACTFEPNGKPCDHCLMCSCRGF
ncbi:MAG TPA: hypothetical protein VJ781_08595 [Pyrinomonadaceae bacterium]|jgi:hypothetical protein|nr:hypothetical protein [Pyrinomonadaceae bacterium]